MAAAWRPVGCCSWPHYAYLHYLLYLLYLLIYLFTCFHSIQHARRQEGRRILGVWIWIGKLPPRAADPWSGSGSVKTVFIIAQTARIIASYHPMVSPITAVAVGSLFWPEVVNWSWFQRFAPKFVRWPSLQPLAFGGYCPLKGPLSIQVSFLN